MFVIFSIQTNDIFNLHFLKIFFMMFICFYLEWSLFDAIQRCPFEFFFFNRTTSL